MLFCVPVQSEEVRNVNWTNEIFQKVKLKKEFAASVVHILLFLYHTQRLLKLMRLYQSLFANGLQRHTRVNFPSR
jgi:hypothetical protein